MPALPRQQSAEAPEAAGETIAATTSTTLRPKVTRVSNPTKPKARKVKKAAKRGGVRALQAKLGLSPDGDFGPSTEKALRRWQKAHGLPVDGKAGPQTLAAMNIRSGKVLKRRPADQEAPARLARASRRPASPAPGVPAGAAASSRSRPRSACRPTACSARPPRRRCAGSSAARACPWTAWPARPPAAPCAWAPVPRSSARGASSAAGAARAVAEAGEAAPRSSPASIGRGQPHRRQALPLRRRPRLVQRHRLRLLGLGLLRAARRRPDLGADDLRRLHELRRLRAPAGTSRSTPAPATST